MWPCARVVPCSAAALSWKVHALINVGFLSSRVHVRTGIALFHAACCFVLPLPCNLFEAAALTLSALHVPPPSATTDDIPTHRRLNGCS
jgi:hypothetical protein